MKTIPINYVMMTSTKGHFNLSTYEETINDLSQQIPLEIFANRVVHIKVSDDTQNKFVGMNDFFSKKNFHILSSHQNWRHFDQSHMSGYINDLCKVFSDDKVLKTPYSLVSEDDFLVRTQDKELLSFIHEAVKILEERPDVVQVRIPRFSNERQRIMGLWDKHQIKSNVYPYNDNAFLTNDWSNNIYIARTRDLMTAMILLKRNPQVFGQHAEHSVSAAMRYLSEYDAPLAVFQPEKIRCFHIGTPEDKRDVVSMDVPLNSD